MAVCSKPGNLQCIGEIVVTTNQKKNQASFEKAKQGLDGRYPPGHFVAFDDGKIVADVASFDELTKALVAVGKNNPDVFVVQAGIDYPDEVFILLSLQCQKYL